MTTGPVPLIDALQTTRDLLDKYENPGQTAILDRIISSFGTRNPDYRLLTGIDMWGGSGAVCDVNLCQPDTPEHQRDRKRFWQAVIMIANEMDRLGVGTARSRQVASVLQKWIDQGIK